MTINLDHIQTARNMFFQGLENVFPPAVVGGTPCEEVDFNSRLNFRLLRYGKGKKVLVIVPHIINRPYILDLKEDVSVIKKWCDSGFSVYMFDWGYPTIEQSKISFSDYVDYLDTSVELIRRYNRIDRIPVMGYCTGGIISLMYASLYPEKVKKLILMATPVDFSKWYDLRILWGKVFDVRAIVSLFGNVPGELIFLFGRNLFMYYFPLFSMSAGFNREFQTYKTYRDALRMNRWFIDTPMIPGSAYVQFIEDCYKHNLLINNKMRIDSRLIDLRKIRCPLLNILARYDHIVPLESGGALRDVYSGNNYEEIVFPSSHVGLSVSDEAHLNLWPKVCKWGSE